MNEENTKKRSSKKTLIIIIFFIITFLIFIFKPAQYRTSQPRNNVACLNNLRFLRIALQLYAQNNSNLYPIPEQWCDLIKPYLGELIKEKDFQCPAALVKARKDNDKDKEEAKCHYAMNPNCEPNSPPDTVLLFETKGGWNLSGGPELICTDNHSDNRCTIYFNDYSSGRFKKEEIPNLNWNDKEEEND